MIGLWCQRIAVGLAVAVITVEIKSESAISLNQYDMKACSGRPYAARA